MDDFMHFVVVDGLLLIALFAGITFLVALAQQYASAGGLMERMAGLPLGVGNVYAAVGGALTPFCSCSTVPVLTGMLQTGFRFGVCVTFLMASPLVNEAVMVVMWQYFGWAYLLTFVALALVLAIVVGMLFDALQLGRYIRPERTQPGTLAGAVEAVSDAAAEVSTRTRLRFAALTSRTETVNVLPYLLVGLVIGGAIYGFVPESWIGSVSERLSDWQLVVIMALLGVPLYFNLVTVIPVAFALSEKGLGIGPITAFLVAGAGTSLPELVLLFRLFRAQLITAYVLTMIATAVAMGFVFSL